MQPFIKALFCITLGLGVFGSGYKALAFQEIRNAKIITFACLENTCTLTIDRDHAVTPETESCGSRVFAWEKKQTDITNLVEQAFREGRFVSLRYSEYHCYNDDRYMALERVTLEDLFHE